MRRSISSLHAYCPQIEVVFLPAYPAEGLAGSQVAEIIRLKEREPLRESPAILISQAKDDPRICVPHDRALNFGHSAPELVQILVRDRHPEPVFPRTGEERRHRGRCNLVELIQIEKEGSARCLPLILSQETDL